MLSGQLKPIRPGLTVLCDIFVHTGVSEFEVWSGFVQYFTKHPELQFRSPVPAIIVGTGLTLISLDHARVDMGCCRINARTKYSPRGWRDNVYL